MKSFRQELEELINKNCKENDSNTPDYILAGYLERCLENFNKTVNNREGWYGRPKQKPEAQIAIDKEFK